MPFVATTHSIWWNGCKPVFVDIDPATGNINPDLIEAAITPKTTAIMPVHVYGKPCDTKRIQEIADTTLLEVNVGSKVPDDFYFVEYVNPRFAFHCEYPSFLDKGEAPANGDGRVFSNNELVITVYGEYDELGNADIKKAFAAAKSKTDTLQTQADNWYKICGNDNHGNTYCRKVVEVDGAFATVLATYPTHFANSYAPIVNKVMDTLSPLTPSEE